jgi:putative spermidine/putrescine transport system ATP-binding protein
MGDVAAAGAGAGVELQGVTKRYADHVAVRDLSFRVAAGEFVSLLGPSGSGKTTTLDMIAGFTPSTAGTITMDDRVLDHLPPHRRGIGVVFQHYALFPHMTIEQNIAFPLRQRRMVRTAIAARVAEVLDMVSLTGLGHRRPREISGGQQQRVAVARALAAQPRLLLMDEPLGALDKNLRQSLQTEISRLHRDLGITFVYVTHDQDEALALSDRVVVFNDGRVEQIGSPSELYDRPATLFVARFLGESNVLNGRLDPAERVVVTPAGPLAAGTGALPGDAHASIVVRPERCRIRDAAAAHEPGTSSVAATVRSVLHLGANWVVHVDLPDGTAMSARTMREGALTFRPGDPVQLTWRVEDTLVLPTLPGGHETR